MMQTDPDSTHRAKVLPPKWDCGNQESCFKSHHYFWDLNTLCRTSEEMNSMTPQPSEIANSLSQKFQVLHDAFTDLASEAAQFHNDLPVEDPASRTLFTALSRILAFSDHVHVALNLMGAD